jgi:hypothetical protein
VSSILGHIGADTGRDTAEVSGRRWPGGWQPRPDGQDWWQTRQNRDALVTRLSGLFIDADHARRRDAIRRRGLRRLLDWLEQQPGRHGSNAGGPVAPTPPAGTGPTCRCAAGGHRGTITTS